MRARCCLVLAPLLLGCGLGGDNGFPGLPIQNISPWLDQGPVLLCDRTTRLGSPSLSAAGLCLDPARPAKSCTPRFDGSNDGCATREACVCGLCRVPRCDGSDECARGFTCSVADGVCDRACAADADCAAGELCVPGVGVCRGRCATDGDCQNGESCQGGRCVPATCASDQECASGCDLQRTPALLRSPTPIFAADPWGTRLFFEETSLADGTSRIRSAEEQWGAEGHAFQVDETPLAKGRAPTVAYHPDLLLAFSDGNGRLLAADGPSFDTPRVILTPSLDWERGGLFSPSLMSFWTSPSEATLFLYYAASRAPGEAPTAIGLAVSTDGIHFARLPAPVLTIAQITSPDHWWGIDALDSPFAEILQAVDRRPYIRLWFAARGTDEGPTMKLGMAVPEDPNWSIGEASSLDGRAFVPWPYGPVFHRTINFQAAGALEPAAWPVQPDPVIATPARPQLLYYRASSADGRKSGPLSYAVNPPEDGFPR